jgi:DNA adenine methylase
VGVIGDSCQGPLHAQAKREAATVDFGRRPFLRWAGGKQYLLPRILGEIPDRLTGRYFEPFLGAGSVYLALAPAEAVLSDLNEHLIDTYVAIRDAPDEVAALVAAHARADSPDHYYQVRHEYNAARASPARAAMFIYLNRAGYNGVFRVNRGGEYNVPYGQKDRLTVPSQSYLQRMARTLSSAQVRAEGYDVVLEGAEHGDLVYLDPPYPPLNGTAYFTHYTKERFGDADQRAVAELARSLRDRGCRVLVTNADTALIRELYDDWYLRPLTVPRWVTGRKRYRVQELIISSHTLRGG